MCLGHCRDNVSQTSGRKTLRVSGAQGWIPGQGVGKAGSSWGPCPGLGPSIFSLHPHWAPLCGCLCPHLFLLGTWVLWNAGHPSGILP